MVSLTLWPVVTVFSLVAIPFLLTYPAIEFIVEAPFGISLPCRSDSDGTDSA